MSEQNPNSATSTPAVQLERVFQRFTDSQRWEHWILLAQLHHIASDRFAAEIPNLYLEPAAHCHS